MIFFSYSLSASVNLPPWGMPRSFSVLAREKKEKFFFLQFLSISGISRLLNAYAILNHTRWLELSSGIGRKKYQYPSAVNQMDHFFRADMIVSIKRCIMRQLPFTRTHLPSLSMPSKILLIKKKMGCSQWSVGWAWAKRLRSNDMVAHIPTMSCILTGPPFFCVTSYLFGEREDHKALNDERKPFAWQNSCTRRRYWRF